MEHSDPEMLTPFDRLIFSRQLQMLKLMIPYVPPANQRMLAVCVRFLELEQTISFFSRPGSAMHMQTSDRKFCSPADLIDELRPYLGKEQQRSVDSILNLINIMEMASAMEQMASDKDGHSGSGEINPAEILKGMLTPEQQEMFEMYSAVFSETGSTAAQEKRPTEYGNSDMKGVTEDG